MGYPFVSIIIPNYNGKHLLKECLDSLFQVLYPKDKYEIIVVDNASSDGSVSFICEKYPTVRIVSLRANYGFCVAVNEGAKVANGDYLVLLNNDVRVHPKWLRELVFAAETMGSANIYTSKILMMSNPLIIDYAGGKIPLNARGYSEKLGMKDNCHGNYQPTAYPCATSMLIRKDIFIKLGGFDEDYFACLDDVDFGIRAWIYGYKVYLVPSSIVYHRGSATVKSKGVYFSKFHHTKNALMNILKNFETKNVIRGLLIEVIFNLYEIYLALKKTNAEDIKARFNAAIWILQNLKKIWYKRWIIQLNRKHSDKIFERERLFAGLKDSIHAYKIREKLLVNITKTLKGGKL